MTKTEVIKHKRLFGYTTGLKRQVVAMLFAGISKRKAKEIITMQARAANKEFVVEEAYEGAVSFYDDNIERVGAEEAEECFVRGEYDGEFQTT